MIIFLKFILGLFNNAFSTGYAASRYKMIMNDEVGTTWNKMFVLCLGFLP